MKSLQLRGRRQIAESRKYCLVCVIVFFGMCFLYFLFLTDWEFGLIPYITYNCTTLVWAPYGHLWRNLKRVSTIEILSHISLQKSPIIREEEVYSLLRQLFKVSNIEPQKVDFKYLCTLLVSNIMMRMVAGKPCVGEEFACMDVRKKLLKEFKEVYFPSLTVNICDFFPILRWVSYKGLEKNMIRMHRKRDEVLGRLIEEISRLNNDNVIDVKKKRTLIETLFSLRKSEPEFFSDEVIKSLTLVSLFTSLSLLLNGYFDHFLLYFS